MLSLIICEIVLKQLEIFQPELTICLVPVKHYIFVNLSKVRNILSTGNKSICNFIILGKISDILKPFENVKLDENLASITHKDRKVNKYPIINKKQFTFIGEKTTGLLFAKLYNSGDKNKLNSSQG